MGRTARDTGIAAPTGANWHHPQRRAKRTVKRRDHGRAGTDERQHNRGSTPDDLKKRDFASNAVVKCFDSLDNDSAKSASVYMLQ